MRRDIREGEMTEIDQVREALVKAMLILRMMPLSYQYEPSRMRSQWPEFNRGPEQVGGVMRRPVRAKATPQQIALMEYWLDLMLVLDDDCRRIVMARACRITWRRLEEMDGRSHTTLRKVERRGLEVLALPDQGEAG